MHVIGNNKVPFSLTATFFQTSCAEYCCTAIQDSCPILQDDVVVGLQLQIPLLHSTCMQQDNSKSQPTVATDSVIR